MCEVVTVVVVQLTKYHIRGSVCIFQYRNQMVIVLTG